MRTSRQIRPEDVRITVRGELPEDDVRDYARRKIAGVTRVAPEPVLDARVRLVRHNDRALRRPVTAQANLDVNGHPVRAQLQAVNTREAVDLLAEKLRNTLTRYGRHWSDIRGRMPSGEPHEWRHRTPTEARPTFFPRPPDDRKVIRHKTFALATETVDEAAFELDSMDYDFHLFTEISTGQDSVLYRSGATGYRLAQLVPTEPGTVGPTSVPLTVSDQPAPVLDTPGAIHRLGFTGRPFVFFRKAAGGRGAVLYRRYDGHYGLIDASA